MSALGYEHTDSAMNCVAHVMDWQIGAVTGGAAALGRGDGGGPSMVAPTAST